MMRAAREQCGRATVRRTTKSRANLRATAKHAASVATPETETATPARKRDHALGPTRHRPKTRDPAQPQLRRILAHHLGQQRVAAATTTEQRARRLLEAERVKELRETLLRAASDFALAARREEAVARGRIRARYNAHRTTRRTRVEVSTAARARMAFTLAHVRARHHLLAEVDQGRSAVEAEWELTVLTAWTKWQADITCRSTPWQQKEPGKKMTKETTTWRRRDR